MAARNPGRPFFSRSFRLRHAQQTRSLLLTGSAIHDHVAKDEIELFHEGRSHTHWSVLLSNCVNSCFRTLCQAAGHHQKISLRSQGSQQTLASCSWWRHYNEVNSWKLRINTPPPPLGLQNRRISAGGWGSARRDTRVRRSAPLIRSFCKLAKLEVFIGYSY